MAQRRNASASPWEPPASEIRAASTSRVGSRRRDILGKASTCLRTFLYAPRRTCEREETGGCFAADLARTCLIPARLAGRQACLRGPVARQPEVPRVREGSRALRRDRSHAWPLGPPRLGRGDQREARSRPDRRADRAQGLAERTR